MIVATVAGTGTKAPERPMMAGNGADPEVGYLMLTVNEMLFPASVTLTVRVVPTEPRVSQTKGILLCFRAENYAPEIEPLTLAGFGGSVPSSYCWKSLLISC